jgi:hypothetical protein
MSVARAAARGVAAARCYHAVRVATGGRYESLVVCCCKVLWTEGHCKLLSKGFVF